MIPFDIGDPANPNAPYTPGTPITLPGSTARLIAINDSPYQILLQFGGLGNAGGVNFKVPSGVARIFPVQANAQQVSWMIDQSLAPATAVISDLTLETYTLGEELPNQYPIVRQISVGNSIVTNTSPANALEQDLLLPFVLFGLTATKDGANPKQLDVTNGVALLRQSDNSLGRVAPLAQNFLVSTPSATYFLDLNPDGTYSFATTHSTQTNELTIAVVTTDGIGNIATVTEGPIYPTTLLNGITGLLALPTQFRATAVISPLQGVLTTAPVSDTAVVLANVSGDTRNRAQLYVRGADGYGGLAGGPGGATAATAHLYAQANGWVIQEALAGLGGQATAGKFGVPVIAAEVQEVSITNTSATQIASVTVPNDGKNHLVRCWGDFNVGNGNTNNGTVSLWIDYTDPIGGALTGQPFNHFSSGSVIAVAVVSIVKSPFYDGLVNPRFVITTPGSTVSVWYQNQAAGTIADRASAVIELLS